MLHKNALKLLMPIELTGNSEADLGVEGQQLDSAQERAEDLLQEMYPDTTNELLAAWERVCGLIPAADETLQTRRNKVVLKIRERGGLSVPYFLDVIEKAGYYLEDMGFQDTDDMGFLDGDMGFAGVERQIIEEYEEYKPFMAGIGRAGDALYVEEVIFVWMVSVSGQPVYYFRAGESSAGEPLMTWEPATVLEALLNDLKPAHTYLVFNYS